MKKNELKLIIDNIQREQELIQQHENSINIEIQNLWKSLPNGFEMKLNASYPEIYLDGELVRRINKEDDSVFISLGENLNFYENVQALSSYYYVLIAMHVLNYLERNANE